MRELIVDSFAGGGGASTGIEMATGRSPDIAINHDEEALAMHAANHPGTLHLSKNIWQVDPLDYVQGKPVGLAWFSPDCKHFSKAKGAAPVKRNIRDLAWVVVLWARRVRPRVICLENVEEFKTWGPLGLDNKPCPDRKGETFNKWTKELKKLGYKVQFRELRACDYGAPTIRKRLFMVARCDGLPIVWLKPTHGAPDSKEVLAGKLLPWRTAASIIDWSLPCPSIFDTSAEIKAKYGLRAVRPLADNTLRRVAKGVVKYLLEAKKPFLVTCNHSGAGFRGQSLDDPMATITANRDAHGLVVPVFSYGQQGGANRAADEPLHTITASNKDTNALVSAHISRQFGQGVGHGCDEPSATITSGGAGKSAVVAAFLAQHNTGVIGRPADAPLSTITGRGTQQAVVAAHMINLKGSDLRGSGCDEPAQTLCAGGGHAALVSAFLIKYYGAGVGQYMSEPLHTDTTRDRFGLVTVQIDGASYVLNDIGMRMLTPRERFRAQGFPDSYDIDTGIDGKQLTQTAQGRMCGNSVCPPLARAIVAANYSEADAGRVAA